MGDQGGQAICHGARQSRPVRRPDDISVHLLPATGLPVSNLASLTKNLEIHNNSIMSI